MTGGTPSTSASAFPQTVCKGTDYECECDCKCAQGLDAQTGCNWPDCECGCDAACIGCRVASNA